MHTDCTYPHQELSRRVIGCFFDVYNELGSGFREIVYERALAIALTDLGLWVEHQVPAEIFFRKRSVGSFRADLIVERTILLELKARPELEPSHVAQVINMLRATGLEVGLLLNFGPKPQIKRLVLSHKGHRSR